MVAALLLIAAAAPWLAPYDPAEQLDPPAGMFRPPGTVLAAVHLEKGGWRLADRVRRTPAGLAIERLGRVEVLSAAEVLNLTPEGVSDRRVFLLGSDRFGRDLLSRMLYGARVSLAVGLIAMAMALTVGVALGSAAALGGRLVDALVMRGVDALLSFPFLFLMLALSAFFRPGSVSTVVILGLAAWTGISRLTRAEILSLKNREFVLAARAIGQRPLVILLAPPAAECPDPGADPGDAAGGHSDPRRVLPVVPRPRHPAADAELGKPDFGGAQRPPPGVVGGHLPGRRHRLHRDRLQPARRRPAGPARSAGVATRRC